MGQQPIVTPRDDGVANLQEENGLRQDVEYHIVLNTALWPQNFDKRFDFEALRDPRPRARES